MPCMSKVEYLIFSMAQIEGAKIKTGGSSMLKILQEKNVKVMCIPKMEKKFGLMQMT